MNVINRIFKLKVKYIITIFLWILYSCIGASCNELQFTQAIRVARITGAATKDEKLLSTNNTQLDYNVGGTDLGIIWEMEKGKYGIFFGDTYGRNHFEEPIIKEKDWRCNVLAFSQDQQLEDGLTISKMATDSLGAAREIIYGGKDKSGVGNWTSIPTAAVRANGKDYVHYMNVKHWNSSNWGTNYSSLYRSDDNGATWRSVKSVKFGEDSNFGQGAFYKKDGYVYMIGTESGRQSSPRLARFFETDIERIHTYEYWNSEEQKWIRDDEEKATNLFDDIAGELSFLFHEKSKRWILLYFNEKRYEISARYTSELTGKWSPPHRIASGKKYPKLYGSYIHPVSAHTDSLYFLMSLWNPYNVFLMRTIIHY